MVGQVSPFNDTRVSPLINERRDSPTQSAFTSLPDILFVADIAKLFRTSRRTIDRRRTMGTFPIPELPSIDTKPRWSKTAVMRFLSESEPIGVRRRPFSGARTGRR